MCVCVCVCVCVCTCLVGSVQVTPIKWQYLLNNPVCFSSNCCSDKPV